MCVAACVKPYSLAQSTAARMRWSAMQGGQSKDEGCMALLLSAVAGKHTSCVFEQEM